MLLNSYEKRTVISVFFVCLSSLARNDAEAMAWADSSAKTTTIAVIRVDTPLLGSLIDSDSLISANTLADTTVDAVGFVAVAHRRDVVTLSLESLESTATDLTDVLEALALAVLDEAIVDLLEDLGALVDSSGANLDGRGTSEHELDDIVP